MRTWITAIAMALATTAPSSAQPVPHLPTDVWTVQQIGPPPENLENLAGTWHGDALLPAEPPPAPALGANGLNANGTWGGDPAPMISVLWLITDDLHDIGYTVGHAQDRLAEIGRMFRQSGVDVSFRFAGGAPFRLPLLLEDLSTQPTRHRDGWDLELILAAITRHDIEPNPLGWVLGRQNVRVSARDWYGADVVFVETHYRGTETGACGIAIIGPNVDYPVGAGTIGQVCPPHVLAHEMGHMLGLQHDRYTVFLGLKEKYGLTSAQAHAYLRAQGTPAGSGPPYAFGYLNCRRGQGSIMSYTWSCISRGQPEAGVVEEFSNPNRGFGVWGQRPDGRWSGPANAARRLRETAGAVAGFRRSLR